jgi:hypothetical protein
MSPCVPSVHEIYNEFKELKERITVGIVGGAAIEAIAIVT